ncbi:MAG: hypothetical protein ACYTBP_09995 [Planctomycetota bacterium]|jgi:hypothetical protein
MSSGISRRTFVKGSLLTPLAGSLALNSGASRAHAQDNTGDSAKGNEPPTATNLLPTGKIGHLEISRMLLGGNLLTHYTHSRDLKYVYKLAANYNTEEKILETLALAEEHGINTLSIHTVPWSLKILQKHRKRGGKMQWIICPTAPVTEDMNEYTEQVRQLLGEGTDAIYLWGVRSDQLVKNQQVDLIAKAVQVAKDFGALSGVGAHDLNVIKMCEENKIENDFYIKTMHHHDYPTAPKPDELGKPYNEIPGYWCDDPQGVIDVMKSVTKPWIAFKVLAAGAIPPKSGFEYSFRNGADFILAGMFDFEIREDANIVKNLLEKGVTRDRPWRA